MLADPVAPRALLDGHTATAIAESTGYSAYRVGQLTPDGERWTSRTVAAWMAERMGRPVAYQRGWDYLHRLGKRLRQRRPVLRRVGRLR